MPASSLPTSVWRFVGSTDSSTPVVVVLGGTHGDETLGVTVIQKLCRLFGMTEDFPDGSREIPFLRGELYLGIGNPQAVSQQTRSVSGIRDLNRCFHESFFSDPLALELPDQRRALELAPLLARADYLFDLHSVSAHRSVPFVGLTTYTTGHERIIKHIPVRYVLDANRILGLDVNISPERMEQTPTTCSWTNRHGGIGLCYEMGSQRDLGRVDPSVKVVLNLLRVVGSLSDAFFIQRGWKLDEPSLRPPDDQAVYRLVHCEQNKRQGFRYAHPRLCESWTPVRQGELIGVYENGEEVRAVDDGLLVFQAGEHSLLTNPSLYYLAKLVAHS